jgi:uncharacterized protein (DUF697 family)
MEDRRQPAMTVVHKYCALSAGAALIPVAGVDSAVLAGLHVGVVKEVCDVYDVEFSQETAEKIVLVISGLAVPSWISSIATRRALLLVAPPARLIGMLGMSAMAVIVTYTIGRLFIQHFEQGGSLVDFDLKHLRHHVSDYVESGKQIIGRAE